MYRSSLRARVALCLAAMAVVASPTAASATAESGGELFVVHGLPRVDADVLIDGDVVESGVGWQDIAGPFDVATGDHTVTLRPTDGETAELSTTVPVAAGDSIDVVAHRTADPTAPPAITIYPNDLSAVAPDKSRLVVAHAAAVPPADIRVNGEVLFSNVANGEALTLLVPPDTYSVDIVPTGTTGPVVFGPIDLEVAAGQLTRVFALGSPDEGNMDAVVHVLPLPVDGAEVPGQVDTGNGGQAAALRTATGGSGVPVLGLVTAASLLLVTGAVLVRRRAGSRRLGG